MARLIRELCAQLAGREEGQGLAEYALILTMIAVVVIGAVAFFGGQVNTMLSGVGKSI
jgi:pilus assembly protein Flp/PilA